MLREFTVRNNLESRMVSNAKQRAKEQGVPFDITRDDIAIPDVCPVLGITLHRVRATYRTRAAAPSIDRIRPELGYVRGNIRVISHRANLLRNRATAEELTLVAQDAIRLASRDS